tara:strand:+ start:257 stop:484 length:228 start_codon:yes stop_codon:yes gene_type:complete
MSLLTTIGDVPLYSTIDEAIRWAVARGLGSYHTHEFEGQTGYMGGKDHAQATNPSTPTTTTTTTNTSSSSSGGGY